MVALQLKYVTLAFFFFLFFYPCNLANIASICAYTTILIFDSAPASQEGEIISSLA